MKQPSKQELRDRIAMLESYNRGWTRSALKAQAEAKRATFAAYALLATLLGIVILEFGL